ncbi:formate/nitrite transporter family protein [Ornithinimicrobium panacihumi]|uniref:formate/nitrite transporter family protein n=1 Tax=Ornithinimicrobium panacihumi TaxID=2008449 RepID=UPI003F8B1E9D
MADDQGLPHPDEVEDEVVDALGEAHTSGLERLNRSWRALITTGFLGGVEIGLGVLAYMLTLHETGSHLLSALAFSIGFITLYLAHSELFTEGFFYPVMAVFGTDATVGQLLRLWSVTLVANLLGGLVVIALVVTGLPELVPTIGESAHHFTDPPFGWRTVCLSLLGGAAITLMTRMQAGAKSEIATIVAAVCGAFLLAGPMLFHSVLDSIIIFGALVAGVEGVTIGGWLGFFWYAVIFNILGGVLLVSIPRQVRGSEALED